MVHSSLPRYGFSVLCVATALGLALICRYYGFRDVALPLFNLAIVSTTWHTGVRPSVVAVILLRSLLQLLF